MNPELQQAITQIYETVKNEENSGNVADYIPDLANVDTDKFGIHIQYLNGDTFGIGDYQEKFSIQSLVKVLSLCFAYKELGADIWERLGHEPSGRAYNSLIQLELEKGRPRNPFINAGAIVITDIIMSLYDFPRKQFLDFIHELSGDKTINYSQSIATSEKSVGYRNIALCNFMKSFGNIKNHPNEVLDFYFDICSIEMTCEQLSNTFSFLANNGKLLSGKEILTRSKSKRINAIMQTCGFYDESGEFAYRVGLPGKSGVGGGIVAVHPGEHIVTTWSPKLNIKGNSYRGIKFLEAFTSFAEDSIF